MSTPRKKFNKGLIVLSKGERIAVITLLSIIVIFLGFSIFRPMINLNNNDKMAIHNLDSLLKVQERAKKEQQMIEVKEEGIVKERSKTEGARKSDHKKEEKRYQKDAKKETQDQPMAKPQLSPMDLNHSDSTALVALPQIGEVMASRIHRYRNRLGGFVSLEQLFEVKGMDTARFETILPYLYLGDGEIGKINVNQDEFKTLLRHPYLEYEQVKAIVNHRERKGLIKDWTQLCGIVGEVNPRLKEYVTY